MDVHDRGLLYYRLLKFNVKEAHRVVCGQTKMVAEENTVIPRVSHSALLWDLCIAADLGMQQVSSHTLWPTYMYTVQFVQNSSLWDTMACSLDAASLSTLS